MAIHYTELKHGSTEWHNFRMNFVGASEVGIIMNLGEYKSSTELFYEKVGLVKNRRRNVRMAVGLISENVIAELWEHWEASEDKFLDNLNSGNKVRKAERVNFVITNDSYPHLGASLDFRFLSKNGNYCPLECKNKTTQSYQKYQSEMNPLELIQVSVQNLLSEAVDGGELVTFVNNTDLKVLPIDYDSSKQLEKSIMASVKEFWGNVVKARKIITQLYEAQNNHNMRLAGELQYELLQLEPEGNGQAYLDYQTQRFKDKKNAIGLKGNDEQLAMARNLAKLKVKRQKIEAEEVDLKAKLVAQLNRMDKTEIDFGKEGRFSISGGRITNKVK